MKKWIAMAAAVTISGYALAQIAPNMGTADDRSQPNDRVMLAQAGPPDGGPDGGPGGPGGGPGGGGFPNAPGGGGGGPGMGPGGNGDGPMQGGPMQGGPRGMLRGGNGGPVQQMRDYVDLIDKYSKLAADADASGVSAVISAGEILRPKGAPAAIEYFNKLLPQARSAVVQRAIRLQLIDLYKQSQQTDKALEQIELLVKPSSTTEPK